MLEVRARFDAHFAVSFSTPPRPSQHLSHSHALPATISICVSKEQLRQVVQSLRHSSWTHALHFELLEMTGINLVAGYGI